MGEKDKDRKAEPAIVIYRLWAEGEASAPRAALFRHLERMLYH